MALKGAGIDAITRGIKYMDNFTHGNVKGQWFDNWSDVPKGRLDYNNWVNAYEGVTGPVYVVYSYNTPMAWRMDVDNACPNSFDNWVMPSDKYSVTTTNHQNVIYGAIKRRRENESRIYRKVYATLYPQDVLTQSEVTLG